jgi:hypothetical protein
MLETTPTQKLSTRQVPITKAISGLSLKLLTEQKAVQETKLSQRAVQEQMIVTRPATKMPPPPVPPPPLYGGFGLPPGVLRSRYKPLMFFKKSSQQRKYTPSFAAEVLHISAAKAPKRLSGFEIRPIIRNRKVKA